MVSEDASWNDYEVLERVPLTKALPQIIILGFVGPGGGGAKLPMPRLSKFL
jgi:hypothetical protein